MPIPAVDPEIQSLLKTSDAGVFPFYDLDSVLAVPERYQPLREHPDTPVDDRVKVQNLFVPGPGGQLRLRVYRPATDSALPVILYVHSGAFTYGSPEAEEEHALRYALDAEAVVVSVDYRLAPEHPYPAAADDAYAALTWIAAHAAEVGGDPERIAVAGVSAGGNIAASTVLRARDLAGPKVTFQLLIYPVLDSGLTSASMRESTNTPIFDRAAAELAWRYYAEGHDQAPYASPAHAADLGGLPPTLIVVAEVDPLRDEGHHYAERLSAAGVTTEFIQAPGAVHGFDLLFPQARVSERNLADQVRALHEALHP
ncbi:alpha/beta hydrolase [Streptomyces tsukubensis]|uniref:Lipase n=1 Tax=Streptomyces tsukubensis TaxID=83656 RepID=A0A1V4A2Z7_9ACTN|nr:alpha/beta hydrolase [Streptomyces tsukubensis]OON73269.1 lipase [Streptomyces tsukubensis]QFR94537.1 alpha/beta hydrolase fold domain-containing protein [Streptomyces tsukubensis]